MARKKPKKFDRDHFLEMMAKLAPLAAEMQAIVEKYYPDNSLPFWTDLYDEDPDLDLGIGGDDSHGDVWAVLGEGLSTVASFSDPE